MMICRRHLTKRCHSSTRHIYALQRSTKRKLPNYVHTSELYNIFTEAVINAAADGEPLRPALTRRQAGKASRQALCRTKNEAELHS